MKGKSLILAILAAFSIMLSACSANSADSGARSIVMVKNEQLQSYGTGFAAGYSDGKAVIVTAYSTIATANGVPPDTANIKLRDSENDTVAYIIYYNIDKNIALLRLSERTDAIAPMALSSEPDINGHEKTDVYGYSGTGNLMSDFERFSSLDVAQYTGNITGTERYNGYTVYRYSNEFNRALSGGPAVDAKGRVIGMCAYTFRGSEADFSQYILPSDTILGCLNESGTEYITAEELSVKRIVILSVILGAVIFAAIAVMFLIAMRKKRPEKPAGICLNILSGTLQGGKYIIKDRLCIGRDASRCGAVYPIDEPGVSALHCTLHIDEAGRCCLTDNNSKYGVYFAGTGEKLESGKPYTLKNGTAFYIADKRNMMEIRYIGE